MFHSFKNANIKLNNSDIAVSNAQIVSSASIAPVYIQGQKHTLNYNTNNAIVGNLKLLYYLTGVDYVKTFINNESPIAINFGGLTVNSGYLKNYSINCQPNSPVLANVDIVFFEEIGGAFNPSTPTSYSSDILNFSDVTLDTLGAYNQETLTSIVSINYNYSARVQPVYFAKDVLVNEKIFPDRIVFLEKEVVTDIKFDTLNGRLAFSGNQAGVKVSFTHPSQPLLSENFTCSGLVQTKVIESQAGELITNTISVIQNNTLDLPVITGYSPNGGTPGSFFTVLGKNLGNATNIIFGNGVYSDYLDISSDTEISGQVNPNALSGPITVQTQLGETSGQNFTVTFPPMNVTGILPITGRVGDGIGIYGSNFYQVSHVKFGANSPVNSGFSPKIKKINTNFIVAQMPKTSLWDFIQVISSGANLTGTSTQKFVPIYVVSGFSPQTGIPGTLINILGDYFTGVEGVRFNGIYASSFTGLNSNNIVTSVPAGYTKGPVSVYGLSGIESFTPFNFSPRVVLTGITPESGTGASYVIISGINFYPELLCPFQDNFSFKASFNGAITGLYISGYSGFSGYQTTRLTGLAPKVFTTGPVYLFEPDGATMYPSDVIFIKNYDPPVIHRIYPRIACSGAPLLTTIEGDNFFYLTRIHWSGVQSHNSSDSIFGTPENSFISVDQLGKKIYITGAPHIGHQTGTFMVSVETTAGIGYTTGLFTGFYVLPPGIVPCL